MAKRGRGRPPLGQVLPNRAKAAELLEHLAAGGTILSFAKHPANPSVRTIHEWRERDPDFAAQYRAARQRGQEALLEQAQEIADLQPGDSVEGSWRRLQVEARLKILRMWDPGRWGERVQHEHGGGVNITVQTGVPQTDGDA